VDWIGLAQDRNREFECLRVFNGSDNGSRCCAHLAVFKLTILSGVSGFANYANWMKILSFYDYRSTAQQ
jgi:hypothetical protein